MSEKHVPDPSEPAAPPSAPASDRLTRALQDLPRAEASAAFTDRVLARLAPDPARSPAPRRSIRRVTRPALLAAAAVAAIHFAVMVRSPGPPEAPARPGASDGRDVGQVLEALRREQRELAAEVERLRVEDPPAAPVIFVGQSAGVDLVLDLVHFQERHGPTRRGGKP